MRHVAEVDDAGDRLVARFDVGAAANEHVAIVQVAVNRSVGKGVEERGGARVERRDEAIDRAAELGVGYESSIARHHRASVREIPVEIAMDRRRIEVRERRAQRPDAAPELFEERCGAMRCEREGPSGKPGDSPCEVLLSIGARNAHERLTIRGEQYARGDVDARGDVRERGLLRLEERALLARVGDLEHESRAVRPLDAEVLIALARELRRAPLGAEVVARDALGGLRIEAWAVLEHGGKG